MALSYTIAEFDPRVAADLSSQIHLHPVIAKILAGRGLTTPEAATHYLNPDASMLHDPFLLAGMESAVARIGEALDQKQKIVIHGDYDVDGLTSTSLLLSALRSMGGEVDYYIPNRLDEGYGLKIEGIQFARGKGAKLIITCDCGTSSIAEIEEAARLGIDVIVTDHHEPESVLPPAVAVINPKREDSAYPFRGLAGVGVAAKVVMALQTRRGIEPQINNILRIASIGTIADVVPLVDENRFIAQQGLALLGGTPNVGLRELFRIAGIEKEVISSYDIGFRLAPRLNAAGRFGQQDLAMELLFTRSADKARTIAGNLNELNTQRQGMVESMLVEARELVESRPNFAREKVIVVGKSGWHKGLVGLVASKCVEAFRRPTLAYAEEEGIAQGSGRSIQNFNLVENLGKCADIFSRYGGHAMAVGFELPTSRVGELRERLQTIAAEIVPEAGLGWTHAVDAEVGLDELDDSLIDLYPRMEPFGYGNEAPLLLARNVRLATYPNVLKNKHLKLSFSRTGTAMTALAWNFIERRDELVAGARYDIIFALSINRFRNNAELQLVLKDFDRVG